MRRSIGLLLAGVLACLAGMIVSASSEPSGNFRVVAYVAGWSPPPVIQAEKLTHINFAFARIGSDGKVMFEDPAFAPVLKSLVELKQRNPRLRVLISIGGWEADGFSDAALSEVSRESFARSAITLMRTHGADGLDLDWEYPGQGVAGIKYRPEDRRNFTLLLEESREQLDAASKADGRAPTDRYLLTIASADREYFDYTEMDRLHVHLDWINVMGYDFFNSLTSTTGHHAGLYASVHAKPTDRNADASIRQHLGSGIPREKLVLGVAFYGRGFAGVNPLHDGLNQPYHRYEGDHPYAELAGKLINQPGFLRHWDDRAKAPFLWNSATSTFITYEDPQSLRMKAEYVRDRCLGGMMFWELSQDRDDELLDVIVTSLH